MNDRSDTQGWPYVLAVVINWNGGDHLAACLEALRNLDYPEDRLHVCVIDNDSTDGSHELVTKHFPEHELRMNPRNIGCAAAENQGLEYALERAADYVWLLNNDVEPQAEALKAMVGAGESDRRIGIIGPALYELADVEKEDSLGYKIDLWTGRFKNLTTEQPALRSAGEVVDVDVIQGCAALVKTSVPADIGLYYSAFEAYFEESDFQVRARRKGYRVVTVRSAKVRHKKAASYNRVIWKRAWLLLRNLILFECRNARRVQLLVFFPYFLVVHLPYFLVRGSLYAVAQRSASGQTEG